MIIFILGERLNDQCVFRCEISPRYKKQRVCCKSFKKNYYHSTWVGSTLIILFAELLKFSNIYTFRKKKFREKIKNLMEHLVIYIF